jgi:DNA-binding NtrC family response regulator
VSEERSQVRAAGVVDERSQRTAIDVIVSDVMMPGMSGPELLKRLSSIAPQALTVLMSGHAETTVLAPEPGLRSAFLPTPFTPNVWPERSAMFWMPPARSDSSAYGAGFAYRRSGRLIGGR